MLFPILPWSPPAGIMRWWCACHRCGAMLCRGDGARARGNQQAVQFASLLLPHLPTIEKKVAGGSRDADWGTKAPLFTWMAVPFGEEGTLWPPLDAGGSCRIRTPLRLSFLRFASFGLALVLPELPHPTSRPFLRQQGFAACLLAIMRPSLGEKGPRQPPHRRAVAHRKARRTRRRAIV